MVKIPKYLSMTENYSRLLTVLMFCTLVSGIRAQDKVAFTLNGTIKHAHSNKVYIAKSENWHIGDTVLMHDGHFTFTDSIEGIQYYYLWVLGRNVRRARNKFIGFYAEEGQAMLTQDMRDLKATKIEGPEAMLMTVAFARDSSQQRYDAQSMKLGHQYMAYYHKHDTLNVQRIRAMTALYMDSTAQHAKQFILANPSSFYSAFLLDNMGRPLPDSVRSMLYHKLSPQVQRSDYARYVKQMLDSKGSLKPGGTFRDMTFPDSSGRMVSLHDISAPLVLVDLWASWCSPCRKANKELLPIYNTYHSKGFEVYSVSIDESKGLWMDAVRKDAMPWVNLIDNRGFKGIAATLGVEAIPYKVLIDRNRKIIAVNPSAVELKTKLGELLK
jgi:thiol-disulfide isomerase/thioredoxin